MKMTLLATLSDSFLSACTVTAQTIAAVTSAARFIIHVNYQIVSTICYYLSLVLTTVFWFLEKVVCGCVDILQHVWEFTSELCGCFCALFLLMWRILVLIYKVLSFLLSSLETLAICLWTGSLVTMTTLRQSATDLIDSCGVTWNYSMEISRDFVVAITGGFSMIGKLSLAIVKGIWSILGCSFASLLQCVWFCAKRISTFCSNVSASITQTLTFSKEAYLGFIICCVFYFMISKLVHFVHARGVTFSRMWRHQNRPQRPRYDFDNNFESDADISENESGESDDDNAFSDENDTLTESNSGEDESGEDEMSDVSDEDTGSEGSLNSQTYSTDDSDPEIDVQLPPPSVERYSLRGRSSTPCRLGKEDMKLEDYRDEIEKERDKRKCVVCQDQNKSVLILPCRHMCLCVDCANHIVRARYVERRVCPLCRQRIQTVMNVYV